MTIPRVASGVRRHAVTLENPSTPIPDGDGGYTEAPAALTPPTMTASIEPASVRALERLAAGTTITTATHLVRLPYHPQVTTETRVKFTDFHGMAHTLEVASVINVDQRDRELALVCTEVEA